MLARTLKNRPIALPMSEKNFEMPSKMPPEPDCAASVVVWESLIVAFVTFALRSIDAIEKLPTICPTVIIENIFADG